MEGDADRETAGNPLRLNDAAPDFRARTTLGQRSLSEYRGRWLIFFSHPADFTPVCTSEFIALARAADKFAAMNCELLALSIDSLYAHLAWLVDIRERFDVTVTFPVIEDPSLAIARAYGMLSDSATDSATVRATYFIDPQGVVRAMNWYPMTVGRSVEEMLRLLAALQATDAASASAPAGWQPGDILIDSAPVTASDAFGAASAHDTWYYRKRST